MGLLAHFVRGSYAVLSRQQEKYVKYSLSSIKTNSSRDYL